MAFTKKTWTTEIPLLPDDANRWEDAMDRHEKAIGDGTLATEAKTLIAAVNELKGKTDTSDGEIDGAKADITELNGKVGTGTLQTSSKALIGAVNEVNGKVADNSASIEDLESDLSTANGKVATLENGLSTANGKISTLESGLESLEGLPGDVDDLTAMVLANSAAVKNCFFEDKKIGTTITEEQSAAIKAGTFEGLAVGNYWENGGIKYRIAGMDIFYMCGDNVSLGHHVVVVPDKCIKTGDGSTTHWMQDTDTTTGGYVGSKMYTETLPNTILPIVEGVFGEHILQHREILCNAVSNGASSGWAWYDRKIDLMCEAMLYGTNVFGNGKYNVGLGHKQLPLFRMKHELIHAQRSSFWLRDVVSSSNFAYCHSRGHASHDSASHAWYGVRPYFLLQ